MAGIGNKLLNMICEKDQKRFHGRLDKCNGLQLIDPRIQIPPCMVCMKISPMPFHNSNGHLYNKHHENHLNYEYKHGYEQEFNYKHKHDHDHKHEHNHKHEYDHDHKHEYDHDHKHEHNHDHNHEHNHDHKHEHNNKHEYDHDHKHEHYHKHGNNTKEILKDKNYDLKDSVGGNFLYFKIQN